MRNRSITPLPARFLCTAALLTLAACGGGGGSGDQGSGNNPPAVTAVLINRDNMNSVAQAAADVASSTAGAAFMTGGTVSMPTPAVALAAGQGLDASVASRVLPRLVALAEPSAGALPMAAVSNTAQCKDAGSFTLAYDDRNSNGRLDVSEPATVTFSNCRTGALIETGKIQFVFSKLAGVQGSLDLAFSTEASDYRQACSGCATLQVDGSAGMTLQQRADGMLLTVVHNGQRHRVHSGANLVTDMTMESGGMTGLDGSAVTTVAIDQMVRGTWAGVAGRMRVATGARPLVTDANGELKADGELMAYGQNGKLRITALGGQKVRLELDADNNDFYEYRADATLVF